MLDATGLLAVYDGQLRGEAEVRDAVSWGQHGPLHWARFGASGFVGYRTLEGWEDRVDDLVRAARDHFAALPEVTSVEWKTRGHDHAPGLAEILAAYGFVAGERESVMLGEAELVAAEVPLPDGVTLRRITAAADVARMAAMQAVAFGDGRVDADQTAELLRQLGDGTDALELWIAEADGEVISAGRLSPVAGTDVAGLWGGSTLTAWRGQGVYRALTAARARSALRRGFRYLHSDSTEFSRPILERSGFREITTTTPYEWHRPAAGDAGEATA